ncbi:hypothetical protein BDZ97DRAFT_1778238 [Flammula alnicola]|nr:hypothetical protein BDZ97DRAFT_1787324 [Flammula alnicola]KAF8972890.1 hypothetical protein BDZ97DRAFT_1778238 [Flammula alnicola]
MARSVIRTQASVTLSAHGAKARRKVTLRDLSLLLPPHSRSFTRTAPRLFLPNPGPPIGAFLFSSSPE